MVYSLINFFINAIMSIIKIKCYNAKAIYDLSLNNSITDWISAFGAIASVITAIFVFKYTLRQSKKNEEILAIERKAKLYSYPIINSNIISINYSNDITSKFLSLDDYFNTLSYDNEWRKKDDYKILNITFELKNLTNILPTLFYVKDLTIIFSKNNKILKNINLFNYNKTYKLISSNCNNNQVSLKCLLYCTLNKIDFDDFLNNSNEYDILIELNLLFKNVFNIVTPIKYTAFLEKKYTTKDNQNFINQLRFYYYELKNIYEDKNN